MTPPRFAEIIPWLFALQMAIKWVVFKLQASNNNKFYSHWKGNNNETYIGPDTVKSKASLRAHVDEKGEWGLPLLATLIYWSPVSTGAMSLSRTVLKRTFKSWFCPLLHVSMDCCVAGQLFTRWKTSSLGSTHHLQIFSSWVMNFMTTMCLPSRLCPVIKAIIVLRFCLDWRSRYPESLWLGSGIW